MLAPGRALSRVGASFLARSSDFVTKTKSCVCLKSVVKQGRLRFAKNQTIDGFCKGGKMSKILDEVLTANAAYASSFGEKGELALPPARRFAILTCMDARLDPAKYAGLSEGDAHVIRNAGARASDDAIRSLVISHKLLGTMEWFVVHHTNCGMELFCDEIMGDLLEGSLATASFDGKNWSNPQHMATFVSGGARVEEPETSGGGCAAGHFIKWLTIKNQEDSVAQDVARIRSHPLVPKNVPIYGYIYDVTTGKLIEVPKATQIGRPA
jgi:carbonic anhydrase